MRKPTKEEQLLKRSLISKRVTPPAKKYGRPEKRVLNGKIHRKKGPARVAKIDPEFVRPTKYLTTLITKENVVRLEFPRGCFNPGIIALPGTDKYVCVYRPNEYQFYACLLAKDLSVVPDTLFKFHLIKDCADPRLVWLPDNRLLMVYSSVTADMYRYECIRGAIIMDLNVSTNFINSKPFRISPENLSQRQKNWMPFVHDDRIYMIGSTNPHTIYELKLGREPFCEKKFETKWLSPWFYSEFLRGNTNPVQLEDGNYLGTFHSVVTSGSLHYYDNGCYVFEGKPPFKVLRCANRTYLKSEDATERHFRKKGLIQVCFPVGMIREDKNILISYGDNDSCIKVLKTTVQDMLDTTLETYL